MKDGYKKSGWVLPHGSLRGGGVERIPQKIGWYDQLHMELEATTIPQHPNMRDVF